MLSHLIARPVAAAHKDIPPLLAVFFFFFFSSSEKKVKQRGHQGGKRRKPLPFSPSSPYRASRCPAPYFSQHDAPFLANDKKREVFYRCECDLCDGHILFSARARADFSQRQ